MKRSNRGLPEELLTDRLPIDVMPFSNGEFVPPEPTDKQVAIMKLAREYCDRGAKKMGVSRRHFLQTGAAYAFCLAAVDKLMGCYSAGSEAVEGGDAIDLADSDDPNNFTTVENLPDEWIFDIQTHHAAFSSEVSEDWRTKDPTLLAQIAPFFLFPTADCIAAGSPPGTDNAFACISRAAYQNDIFVHSATTAAVLSAVPYHDPDANALPFGEAVATACSLPSHPCFLHVGVHPNRATLTTSGLPSLDVNQGELDMMECMAQSFRHYLRGWKVYPLFGEAMGAPGWWLDDMDGRRIGKPFLRHVQYLGKKYGTPNIVCVHKGFSFPGTDPVAAAARDIGVVAASPEFSDVHFIVYHSCMNPPFDMFEAAPYPTMTSPAGRTAADDPGAILTPSIVQRVDGFITALRENGWSARHFARGGRPRRPFGPGEGDAREHANVPNVYAELGTAWKLVMDNPMAAGHLLGKLIYYVGPKRVVWGTDSLWSGPPQAQIVMFRTFEMPAELREMYHLPYGLDGDVDDPSRRAKRPARSIRNAIFGRNAMRPYFGIENGQGTLPEPVACPDYADPAPSICKPPSTGETAILTPRSNRIYGPRSRRDFFAGLREDPWASGRIARTSPTRVIDDLKNRKI